MKATNMPKAYATIKKVLTIDPFYFKREFVPLYQMPKEDVISEEIAYTGELIKALDDKQKEEGYCVLSILNLVKGNADESSKILSSIGQADSSEKLMVAGIIAFHQQKYDDAKKNIDKSLEMDYSNNISHLYAGQISLKNDDLGQARNHFTKAQSADENTSLYAITLLGDIYIKSGEQNAALILWKKVLSLDARYVPAWERILSFNN
jgi:tetratricopeptide (TPR) repeat protein